MSPPAPATSSALFALTAPQARVALDLAHGATISAAASAAGLHRATVHRWLRTPQFVEAVRQSREAYASGLRNQIFDEIKRMLNDPDLPADQRLSLALEILERPSRRARMRQNAT